MRRIINGFMGLCAMLPLVGIVALISGVTEPGDGRGSMTTVEVCLILAASFVFILVLWKVFLIVLNLIAKLQIALLFNGK